GPPPPPAAPAASAVAPGPPRARGEGRRHARGRGLRAARRAGRDARRGGRAPGGHAAPRRAVDPGNGREGRPADRQVRGSPTAISPPSRCSSRLFAELEHPLYPGKHRHRSRDATTVSPRTGKVIRIVRVAILRLSRRDRLTGQVAVGLVGVLVVAAAVYGV